MAVRRTVSGSTSESSRKMSRPATTPQDRENQLVAMAYDLAEKKIRDGTASSQELTHFLKLGSSREFLEQERLRNENLLTEAKIEAMASQKRVEELYANALKAMKAYSGQVPDVMEPEYDD